MECVKETYTLDPVVKLGAFLLSSVLKMSAVEIASPEMTASAPEIVTVEMTMAERIERETEVQRHVPVAMLVVTVVRGVVDTAPVVIVPHEPVGPGDAKR